MAEPDKAKVRELLAGASDGEIFDAIRRERRLMAKEEADKTLPRLVPKIKEPDQASLGTWLFDGQGDGDVRGEAKETIDLILAGDWDKASVNIWYVLKAAVEAFKLEAPPPPPPMP